jgi:hypothetical protein
MGKAVHYTRKKIMITFEVAPGFIHTPFVILIDKAEKAPFAFDGLRARSFIDKDMREYLPRTERRFLGIGCGDYSLDGYEGRVGIERKSMADWQGTLLGWEREQEAGPWTINVDRRKRFKRELSTLAKMECKAVIIEASFGQCLEEVPQWGTRTAGENAKYLHATAIAWQEEFPGVPWLFCDTRELAAITCFRMLEQFWARKAGERREEKRKAIKEKRESLFQQLI